MMSIKELISYTLTVAVDSPLIV